MKLLLNDIRAKFSELLYAVQKHLMNCIRPALANHSLVTGTLYDLPKTKSQLIAENALLRQQLIVLNRQVTKPHFTPLDRILLLCLCSRIHSWKQALLILKPDTLLRWHRQGFRLFWRFKSKPKTPKLRITEATIALIKQMAEDNPLWGAERIRGELLKLDISVSKRTIRKYLQRLRPRPCASQTWGTFLHNYSTQTWACDFLPVVDL